MTAIAFIVALRTSNVPATRWVADCWLLKSPSHKAQGCLVEVCAVIVMVRGLACFARGCLNDMTRRTKSPSFWGLGFVQALRLLTLFCYSCCQFLALSCPDSVKNHCCVQEPCSAQSLAQPNPGLGRSIHPLAYNCAASPCERLVLPFHSVPCTPF